MVENPDSIRVTNIQRMCFHDGPGIRTTVFLKGCCLRCPWCSNPENISFDIQNYDFDGKKGVYGRDYDTEELYKEIIKDKTFWGAEGGVTFSGGEPLMQSDRFLELVKKLKKENVNCAVETSLFAPKEKVVPAAEYIDHFIVDVKILDDKLCSDILGGNLSVYFDNVNTVYEKKKLQLFRLPLCYEYTFDIANRRKQTEFLLQYKNVDIQLFAIHGLGESKYNSLGMECWHGKPVNDDDVKEYCEELKAYGLKAEVIRI